MSNTLLAYFQNEQRLTCSAHSAGIFPWIWEKQIVMMRCFSGSPQKEDHRIVSIVEIRKHACLHCAWDARKNASALSFVRGTQRRKSALTLCMGRAKEYICTFFCAWDTKTKNCAFCVWGQSQFSLVLRHMWWSVLFGVIAVSLSRGLLWSARFWFSRSKGSACLAHDCACSQQQLFASGVWTLMRCSERFSFISILYEIDKYRRIFDKEYINLLLILMSILIFNILIYLERFSFDEILCIRCVIVYLHARAYFGFSLA